MNLTGRGPLGLKGPKPERGTAKARAHIARVKELPCVICAKPGPSDAHHVICDRYGTTKPSDFDVISLCKFCHQVGPTAIHNNKRAWVERNGPDHGYLERVRQMLQSSNM